jgi:hypothetical protein
MTRTQGTWLGSAPWVTLASLCAGLIYWGACRYPTLSKIDGPLAGAYWGCFAAVMMAGLFAVAFLCRRANATLRLSFALLALSTVVLMALFLFARNNSPDIADPLRGEWVHTEIKAQIAMIGLGGLLESLLLVVVVVHRMKPLPSNRL